MIQTQFQNGICTHRALSMSFKVITKVPVAGMPQGSVLQNCLSHVNEDGDLCWSGLWCSMYGSYFEVVKQSDCELYDEEKHDPMFLVKKYWAEQQSAALEAEERATLKRLKAKYEKE
jgi:hypothetical protein